MNKRKFINKDKKAIKQLLKEIGKHRYELALEMMQIKQPPISMSGFYLEATDDAILLCYRYPSRFETTIMKVQDFENLPAEGWELKKG